MGIRTKGSQLFHLPLRIVLKLGLIIFQSIFAILVYLSMLKLSRPYLLGANGRSGTMARTLLLTLFTFRFDNLRLRQGSRSTLGTFQLSRNHNWSLLGYISAPIWTLRSNQIGRAYLAFQ